MSLLTYKEALDYIHGTLRFGIKAGLDNIGRLLGLMSNPHNQPEYVHVAGTNGKGSTAAFISGILMRAGYRTGLYTSPYLERFTERIRIDGCEISEGDLARLTGDVREKAGMMVSAGWNHPTEFEIVTAIAFQYYFEKRCDLVVLEVGLGGRLDATNIIKAPQVAVITTISYDHTAILGDTLEKIAFEKAGIIKRGCDVVLYPQKSRTVEEVFEGICAERGAQLHKVDTDGIRVIRNDTDGQAFDYEQYGSLEIKLLGAHQVRNAVMAVETARILNERGYRISEADIREGLSDTVWTGRFEIIARKPAVVIDAAHNPECCGVLVESLRTYFPDKKITFIMGVMKDKDYRNMIKTVAPVAASFVAVTPSIERALPSGILADEIKYYCNDVVIGDRIEDALAMALRKTGKDGVVCVFGSFIHTGEVRRYLKSMNS